MQTNQHAIALTCLAEKMTAPAWRSKPSWFLVAENDRMIAPEAQRSMAGRMGARVHALDVDHTPLASAPDAVVRVILEAADAIV